MTLRGKRLLDLIDAPEEPTPEPEVPLVLGLDLASPNGDRTAVFASGGAFDRNWMVTLLGEVVIPRTGRLPPAFDAAMVGRDFGAHRRVVLDSIVYDSVDVRIEVPRLQQVVDFSGFEARWAEAGRLMGRQTGRGFTQMAMMFDSLSRHGRAHAYQGHPAEEPGWWALETGRTQEARLAVHRLMHPVTLGSVKGTWESPVVWEPTKPLTSVPVLEHGLPVERVVAEWLGYWWRLEPRFEPTETLDERTRQKAEKDQDWGLRYGAGSAKVRLLAISSHSIP